MISLLVWLMGLLPTALAAERNAYAVKSAFRAVVGQPAKCTVRVLCDNRRAALGVIVDANGHVLTKASELRGNVVCHLYDGRRLAAQTVAIDVDTDLALLKIEAENLPVVQWRETEPPPVGSWLATPGLETIPVSVGVVSVAPRKIERRLPALGIILDDGDNGPRVHRVVPESGADKAGVKAGDTITQLDGKAVKTREALIQAIREYRPGDKVRLQILRDNKEVAIEAVLGDMAHLENRDEKIFQEELGGRLSERRAGFPSALQHDTVLQPNQCGGPLVDLDGKAVGINIARASRVATFALPASVVRSVLEEMKSGQLVSTQPTD